MRLFGVLYDVEPEVQRLDAEQCREIRQQQSQPAADALYAWLLAQRQRVPDGSVTARAINYRRGHWGPLTRYMDDGHLPIGNHWVENQIRPIAIGCNNQPFAGGLGAGQRAGGVMSLIHSARLNGHGVYAYLKDVLDRLPSQPASRVTELFPHRWSPPQ